jgi:hypothetical protein
MIWGEDMEYKGFYYRPDVLEDEDTCKYMHDVYHDGVCIGSINKSQWHKATFEEFRWFVEQYLLKNA